LFTSVSPELHELINYLINKYLSFNVCFLFLWGGGYSSRVKVNIWSGQKWCCCVGRAKNIHPPENYFLNRPPGFLGAIPDGTLSFRRVVSHPSRPIYPNVTVSFQNRRSELKLRPNRSKRLKPFKKYQHTCKNVCLTGPYLLFL